MIIYVTLAIYLSAYICLDLLIYFVWRERESAPLPEILIDALSIPVVWRRRCSLVEFWAAWCLDLAFLEQRNGKVVVSSKG